MTKTKWIIDTDLTADVVAVLMLAASRLDDSLRGVTLVQWLENDPGDRARRELEALLPEGVGIYPGVSRSLLNRSGRGFSFYSSEAEDWAGVSAAASPMPHAVDHMASVLEEASAPVDMLCLGPLTNLALLIRTRPDLKPRIGRVVFRGGSVAGGDITAAAEYNIYQDPEAAHIVFGAGLDLSMVTLEAAEEAVLTQLEADLLRETGKNRARDFGRAVREFPGRSTGDSTPGVRLYSVLAYLYLEKPELFLTERHNVRVDLKGDQTRGSTVTDLLDIAGEESNCEVVLGLAQGDFHGLLEERLDQGGF